MPAAGSKQGRDLDKPQPLRQRSGRSLIDELHSITDRKDRFGSVVRNFNAEFFFKGHDQLDGVEAVCAEVINEACAFRDLVGIYAQMFNNDFLDALCGIAHVGTSTCVFVALPWLAACRIVIKL
ncbi:acyl carrier protein [Brucella melitensis ATCC 23457]|uniref:Acyl carrier protein n=1 Tax=Brucella melitensis biotype 2 (strain ATCC 23457) TaxID=546272 RepID=C0RHG6_BRUMB|nr:acyl carrier protein [Brucella melitensis ATCC 23457]